ncbi:MAG: hypothetical protein QG602_2823, partial [Verrucomicrobiota bacterium]|nr:hypothetical protein [Verrucomicrobiota bacterium]
EDFAAQGLADKRRWLRFDAASPSHPYADNDVMHVEGASGGAYLELLPDTRTNHDEKLVHGENFSGKPGEMAVLCYPVHFTQAGRYYIWGRAFSTGPEDNGLHFGLDGRWPESSQRLQFCAGKFQWTWSSAQRRPEDHCGQPLTLWIDVEAPGVHTVMISMREDGVELDKFVLALDPAFKPEGMGPESTRYVPAELPRKQAFFGITHYKYLARALDDFKTEADAAVPYYRHEAQRALAINAARPELRDRFARATYGYTGNKPGKFDLILVTLTETDGESAYRVLVNDRLVGEFKNPATETDYQEATFTMKGVELQPGDKIAVVSNAVTNGRIPEGSTTAYSRGRWRGLVLQ